jgi:PhoH-like ATPase
MAAVPSLDTPHEGGRRTFVLDTNVFLYDPNCIDVFEENELVIPITVIEEIDRFKKDLNETGRNARMVSRRLDALRAAGSLSRGVELPRGGTLRVEMAGELALPAGFGPDSNDNHILRTALALARRQRRGDVVLVTRDTNMRIKADALGVPAEDYEHARIEFDEQYSGMAEAEIAGGRLGELYNRGWIPQEQLPVEVFPNQFVVLKSDAGDNQSAMVRFDVKQERFRLVNRYKEGIWGIFARNKEQLFALDLLLDDNVQIVTLDGMAGTGKTLLAIACGLRKVADESRYRRLIVSRPIFPLGRDLGFLPGDIGEKLNPWMKPIFDNLELLLGGQADDDKARRGGDQASYQALLDQKIIEVEPLTYIRGRSMPRQFLIVDEAQNLTPHEVKTVITRAGEGTKLILTGDPAQIDNPYVDAASNGLTYTIERFKGSPVSGHITLRKGERSELAELAAKLL